MDLSERTTTTPTTRHPWETARAAFLLDTIDHLLSAGGLRVLDVGSGDAWLASQLVRRVHDAGHNADVTCWDVNFSDDDLARVRALGLAPTKTAPAGPFDLALLLDVIEHVDDDKALVEAAAARVRDGGHVLVSVPCWPQLFSSHDRALAHVRRYTPDSCRDVLRSSGLEIVRSGGFFHALVLPRAAAVVVEKLRGDTEKREGVGAWRGGAAVSAVIHSVLRVEQRASAAASFFGVDVPGLSFFALCRRPHRATS